MAIIDKKYHSLLKFIMKNGFKYEDPNRKGINRIQIPSCQIEYDFKDGFPAITTKKLYWKGVVGELLWFLRGDTNIKYLQDNNIHIWDKDAANFNKNGDLGRVYGAQWREWIGFKQYEKYAETKYTDQISNLIKGLKENPMGTRHIVTAWNPAELDNMALPPCHWSFEILVEPMSAIDRVSLLGKPLKTFTKNAFEQHKLCDKYNIPEYKFTLKWHQRSVDTFLGLPFNIASYALLAHIISKMTNMVPKGIVGDLSNVHIYEPHLDAVKEQLSRDVNGYDDCKLFFSEGTERFLERNDKNVDFKMKNINIKDFSLINYQSYPAIKAEMLAYNK